MWVRVGMREAPLVLLRCGALGGKEDLAAARHRLSAWRVHAGGVQWNRVGWWWVR